MRIGILGTRGIPNHYGGFEQATEFISQGLYARGHEVYVYCSGHHPYTLNKWQDVHLIHCFDAEPWLGTAGQFIYDLNCILDARKRNFDVIVFMGYTSSSIWHRFFPDHALIVSNMVGLEWKRNKYSRPVKLFLQYAEKLAVRYSHVHIVDSPAIKAYFLEKYDLECTYIPYGASLSREEKQGVLNAYGVVSKDYFLLMARMEKENNIHLILDGFIQTEIEKKFLVIGNFSNRFGRKLYKKYAKDNRVIFAGSIYDQDIVDTLRKNALVYFHGHSVGGTNPSLLEAMASKTLIAAHDNAYNRAILGENAFYFSNPSEVKNLVEFLSVEMNTHWIRNNYREIQEQFNWEKIIDQYEAILSGYPVNGQLALVRE